MDAEQQGRLDTLLGDIEQGRLTAAKERQLRGLLAPFNSRSLTMDLADLYDLASFAAGYFRLMDAAAGRSPAVASA